MVDLLNALIAQADVFVLRWLRAVSYFPCNQVMVTVSARMPHPPPPLHTHITRTHVCPSLSGMGYVVSFALQCAHRVMALRAGCDCTTCERHGERHPKVLATG